MFVDGEDDAKLIVVDNGSLRSAVAGDTLSVLATAESCGLLSRMEIGFGFVSSGCGCFCRGRFFGGGGGRCLKRAWPVKVWRSSNEITFLNFFTAKSATGL